MSKDHMGIGSYSGWHSDYRDGYRRDDEMYVDDQCCGNCALHGGEACPLYIDEFERDKAAIRAKEEMRREDAISRDGKPQWCIYWEQQGRSGHYGHQSHRGHQSRSGYQNHRRAWY